MIQHEGALESQPKPLLKRFLEREQLKRRATDLEQAAVTSSWGQGDEVLDNVQHLFYQRIPAGSEGLGHFPPLQLPPMS